MIIPFDLGGIDPKIANAVDDALVSVQTALTPRMADVTYESSLYRSTTGTWTVVAGQQQIYRYAVIGGLMFLNLKLVGTTTSAGMGGELQIRLPGEYKAPDSLFLGTFHYFAATAAIGTGIGFAYASTSDSGGTMRLLTNSLTGAAWPSSETNLTLFMSLVFPVNTP